MCKKERVSDSSKQTQTGPGYIHSSRTFGLVQSAADGKESAHSTRKRWSLEMTRINIRRLKIQSKNIMRHRKICKMFRRASNSCLRSDYCCFSVRVVVWGLCMFLCCIFYFFESKLAVSKVCVWLQLYAKDKNIPIPEAAHILECH